MSFTELTQFLAEQPSSFVYSLGLLTILASFIIAQIIPFGFSRAVHRANYWLQIAVLVLIATVGVTLYTKPEMLGDFDEQTVANLRVWILGMVFVFGYVVGLLHRARSISIFGNGRRALLAFVPIANLMFFFKKPHEYFVQNDTGSRSMRLVSIVLSAALFLGAAVIAGPKEIGSLRAFWASDRPAPSELLQAEIKRRGLGDALWYYGLAAEEGVKAGDGLTLIKVSSTDATLLRRFIADWEDPKAGFEAIKGNMVAHCQAPVAQVVIQAGGSIEHIYLGSDGARIGTFMITSKICAAAEKAAATELAAATTTN